VKTGIIHHLITMNTDNNNNEYDPNWCYYSGMPSPMAYMTDNNITHMKGPQEHKTFKDNRGSYTPISTNELGTIKLIHHKLNM